MTRELLTAAEEAACYETIARHSKSFYVASRLLPREARLGAWALYAFCRCADDAVDDASTRDGARRNVEDLRRRLDLVYRAGGGETLVDQAFGRFVARYNVPRAVPEALVDGFEMDARGLVYETQDELLVYCFRVASTVGLMMSQVMGLSPGIGTLRAADLGVAMQLTNIARDVGEDARMGRIYLPADLCEAVGLDRPALLANPQSSPAATEAVRRLLQQAEAHYVSAEWGVPMLPPACRLSIASARYIYGGIGTAIARNDYDSVSRRASLGLAAKLARLVLAGGWVLARRPRPDHPPGPADARLTALLAEVGMAPGASVGRFVRPGATAPLVDGA